MASYRDSLREEEFQNWIKAALALKITQEGLQIFVEEVLTCVHQDIYSNVRTSKGLPLGATCAHCFTENVLNCPTRGICTSKKNCKFHNGPSKQYVPCPNGICEGVRDEIVQHHRFSGPSWKNTNADKWSTIPWEIAKCFFPPDGYKTVSSIKDSDFNGVISVMMNCEDFQNKLSFIVATQANLLTEVRDIGRRIRHSGDQRVKDRELVDFLVKLRTLLEDKTELANRPEALHAVEQLKKLQTDDFKISAENEGELLKEGLRLRLANHYRTTLADMPISPILGEKNAKFRKFYVAPKIVEKDFRKIGKIDNKESGQKIAKFSDVFLKEVQLLRNVFLVGEPGNGKSTFSVMCALDWTYQYLPAEENFCIKTSFADPEFFKEFAFLFHVTLRDSGKSCDLAEMIKDQLIRKIYHERDADDGYRLLQTVLESETCLIIADGLDEWTHPENVNCTCNTEEKVIPFRNSANKATLLTTTRPWRLSRFRVQASKIDKYLEIEGAADTEQLVENIINILNEGNKDERTPEAFMKMVSAKDLEGLMSAPISITQLVCLWFEGKSLTDSKCDIYAGVINMLSCRLSCMQKGNNIPEIELPSVLKEHECFVQNPMVYLALAKLAYTTLYSECRDSSVVFSNETVNALLSREQVEFALKSGLLTEKKSNSLIKRSSHFSFFHKTLQEFLAALHLCLNENDFSQLSNKYEQDNKENILGDVSQTFIFICGMKPELGVQMSSWINSSRPPYQLSIDHEEVEPLQTLILYGHREARANNCGDIPLYLAHFQIDSNEDVVVLKKLMMINKERIQSLYIHRCNDQINGEELQGLITSSSDSLIVVILWSRDGQYDLSQCHRLEYLDIGNDNTTRVQVDPTNITTCHLVSVSSNVEMYIFRFFKHDQRWSKLKCVMLESVKNVQLLVDILPSLPQLQSLQIQDTDLGELHLLPPASITDIRLHIVTMTAEAVRILIETMKKIPHPITCDMWLCTVEPAREMEDIREHMDSSPSFKILRFDNTSGWFYFKFYRSILGHNIVQLQTDDFKISGENEREISKEDLRLRLANYYQTTLADMLVFPILGEKNAKLRKFYVAPKIVEKDHRNIGKIDNKESGQNIAKFSDVFLKEDQLLRNVFLVGEPGNGKSTFSIMCALDWTHQYLPGEENVGIKTSFADPDFFKEFAFLFHVTLRDSGKTCDLAQMIKDQLIRKIYHEKDADDGYRLLQTVLETETCLIIADGLDEWTHPENVNCTCKTEEKVTPFRSWANKATLLTTTRPWRMSQFRVQDSKIDKYLEIEGAADTEQLVENIINILNGGNEDERTTWAFMKMASEKDLEGLLTAPISITQLVCLWFEGKSLTNSKCDIYAGVINMLSCRLSDMQSGHKIPKIELPSVLKEHECFMRNPMVYLALAKLAYTTLFSECRDSSVVFSNKTVNALLSREQVEFALKSGLVTEKKSNSLIKRSSHFSFFHKTLQEFLAALHLCLNENDYSQLSNKYEQDNKQNILEDVSQTFIFVCGMKPELGVQMSSWINSSRPPYQPSLDYTEDTLLQDLILSGHREARANNYGDIPLYLAHFWIANNHGDIPLSLSHFWIDSFKDVVVLKKLMMINKEHIQSLVIEERNDQINEGELQEVISSSSDSLKSVSLWDHDGQYDLSQCHRLEHLLIAGYNTTRVQVDPTNITCYLKTVSSNVEMYIFRFFKHDQRWSKLQHVDLLRVKNVQLLVDTLPSLPQLQRLDIWYTDLGELHLLPPASITDITLGNVTMTAEAVRSLIETMKNIPHTITCYMLDCMVKPASEMKDIREHMDSSPSFEVLGFHNTSERLYFIFTKM
ncbi:uncharacterized protein LOC128246699 [Mya arenaria]|uniref:uncharacterized protein LOC128246699 n=1 Tax=Mya arenaria TaxID=6604 RepID=UPI0022E63A66|nr:uncharacterized protein LOC128246699 [Mya arenaria]